MNLYIMEHQWVFIIDRFQGTNFDVNWNHDFIGNSVLKEKGSCFAHSRRGAIDDYKTLDELRFEIGDFLDVAILQD